MSKASQPELKKFMDKRLSVQLQGGRKVSGVLRGFDLFLNIVLGDAYAHDEENKGAKVFIGEVVIRGNSVQEIGTLEAAIAMRQQYNTPVAGHETQRVFIS